MSDLTRGGFLNWLPKVLGFFNKDTTSFIREYYNNNKFQCNVSVMSESRNIFCQILYINSESDTQNCKEARIERNKVSTNNISILHPKSIEIQ